MGVTVILKMRRGYVLVCLVGGGYCDFKNEVGVCLVGGGYSGVI